MNFKREVILLGVWEIYEDYHIIHGLKAQTRRRGFVICGCCGDLSKFEVAQEHNPRRPESLAEHSDGLMHLIFSVATQSDLIPQDMLLRVLRVALYHDAPEIETGDIPDDGGRDAEVQDEVEYRMLKSYVESNWRGLSGVNEFLQDYRDFQRHEDPVWQVVYCLDKVAGVLKMLEYENDGIVGSIQNKPVISDLDRRYAAEIGTSNAAEIWARHVCDQVRGLKGADLVYELMYAAFEDIRGKVPEWYKNISVDLLA